MAAKSNTEKVDRPDNLEIQPVFMSSASPVDDVEPFISFFPLPNYGYLSINAYLIRSAEPLLVDTGMNLVRNEFMRALRERISLDEIRWIFLTHIDPDHVGNLMAILDEAPKAQVVTNFLGMGKMILLGLSIERIYLMNPGQSLDVGDRVLTCLRPPTFDAPETMSLFDPKSDAFFSADFGGALLASPVENAGEISDIDLRDGVVSWGVADTPWIHLVDENAFHRELEKIRNLQPRAIFSAHLPPLAGVTEKLLSDVALIRTASPFVGPDQAMIRQIMSTAA